MGGAMREAIKCSLLQQKTTRRTGTLRRKTRVVYGEAFWVVLCVHDDRIPCLEWYSNQETVKDHQPNKVVDLLYCNYVNSVVAEPRCFVVGLSEDEPIELACLEPQTCRDWVEVTVNTLRRLDILSSSTNVYEAGVPAKPSPSEPIDIVDDAMDLPQAAMLVQSRPRASTASHVSFAGSCSPRPTTMRPPLPPRERDNPFIPPNTERRHTDEESVYNTLSCEDSLRTPQDNAQTDFYGTPRDSLNGAYLASPPSSRREPHSLPRANKPSSCGGTPPRSRQDESVYDTLSPVTSSSNVSSSPMQSTMSTNSLCSSLSSELRLSATLSLPPPDTPDFESGSNGYHHSVKYISLNLSVVVEHVLFVEVAGRVWVAGWSNAHDKQLSTVLNIGDELIEVEGHTISDISNVPQIFYTVSNPGTPISMLFRPIPFGTQITLVKPINKSKQIGIVLHKKKNRISQVVPDSSAARRGVPVRMNAALHENHVSSSVITDVGGRRLSPFAKNEQFFARLDQIRDGAEFAITLHPHDFVKELKQQMIAAKHYKMFLAH